MSTEELLKGVARDIVNAELPNILRTHIFMNKDYTFLPTTANPSELYTQRELSQAVTLRLQELSYDSTLLGDDNVKVFKK